MIHHAQAACLTFTNQSSLTLTMMTLTNSSRRHFDLSIHSSDWWRPLDGAYQVNCLFCYNQISLMKADPQDKNYHHGYKFAHEDLQADMAGLTKACFPIHVERQKVHMIAFSNFWTHLLPRELSYMYIQTNAKIWKSVICEYMIYRSQCSWLCIHYILLRVSYNR